MIFFILEISKGSRKIIRIIKMFLKTRVFPLINSYHSYISKLAKIKEEQEFRLLVFAKYKKIQHFQDIKIKYSFLKEYS